MDCKELFTHHDLISINARGRMLEMLAKVSLRNHGLV